MPMPKTRERHGLFLIFGHLWKFIKIRFHPCVFSRQLIIFNDRNHSQPSQKTGNRCSVNIWSYKEVIYLGTYFASFPYRHYYLLLPQSHCVTPFGITSHHSIHTWYQVLFTLSAFNKFCQRYNELTWYSVSYPGILQWRYQKWWA